MSTERERIIPRGDSRLSPLPVSHDALTAVGLSKQDSGSGSTDAVAVDMSVHRDSAASDPVFHANFESYRS